ncbi:hypothetical protein CEE36_03040 [candidate division TA06 bacterium B3_TA06]|uniref:Uncharacterized protein n=1 Tax=candidate division TA06 bacterium B3_TA06 TaxID=2012487 RepID=A0A532V930_UNCT6|nr:MAG: hypothetical protein CEE36_03040 [candidate division TA06 bacterium B3_TA06]
MKKNVFWSAVLVVLVMGAGFVLYGSGENQWSDYAVGGILMSVLDDSEPTHTVGRFQFPALSEEDTFATYVYTYGDVVIFS